ncbi:hypothetical protein AB0I84_05830, partial [Streptomyces spectabilis]|uniref:hypothetical protein n=1 Tax=Streptomyces spectabilis TaxID=68270 RepID=UPI0033F70AA1
MIIVYTPAGGEPEQYDASTLRVSEVSIVQRTIDMKWADIKDGLAAEDLDAMRGIIWVIKKRSQPSLRFSEFDPGITEMVTRMSIEETREYITNALVIVEEDPQVSRDEILAALRKLPEACIDPQWAEAEITAQAEGPKAAPDPEPPAGVETAEEASPSSSLTPTSSEPGIPGSDSLPTSFTVHPLSSMT